MVALTQSESTVYENTRPGNSCDGDYPHSCCCYLGRTPRTHILSHDDYPSRLKREFIGAAAVIGAIMVGAFVLHYLIL